MALGIRNGWAGHGTYLRTKQAALRVCRSGRYMLDLIPYIHEHNHDINIEYFVWIGRTKKWGNLHLTRFRTFTCALTLNAKPLPALAQQTTPRRHFHFFPPLHPH